MKRGFTLVEAVIAAGVMAIAISAFIGAFMSSRYSAALADSRMTALQQARGRMEELLTLTYNQLNAGTYQFSNGLYTVEANAAYPDSVKDIKVTVNWVNPGGTATSSLSLHGSVCYELHQP